jgi:hypothetical protein
LRHDGTKCSNNIILVVKCGRSNVSVGGKHRLCDVQRQSCCELQPSPKGHSAACHSDIWIHSAWTAILCSYSWCKILILKDIDMIGLIFNLIYIIVPAIHLFPTRELRTCIIRIRGTTRKVRLGISIDIVDYYFDICL